MTVLRTTTTVLKHVEILSIQMAFKRVIAWNRMIRGHVNLMISLFWYLYSNYAPCNFNFTGKVVTLQSTGTIMVALFYFPSFFSSENYHLLLPFAHFFNEIVKPKWKTPFSKLIKGHICYISNTRHSKLRGLQRLIPSKNKRLRRLRRSPYLI